MRREGAHRMDTEQILDLLSNVNPRGEGYEALCPAHNDHNPSLSIKEADGKTLIYCHAGCSVEEICDALGIEVKDLYDS